MSVTKGLNHSFGVLQNLYQALKLSGGSVLVYLIVLILIFGILGVTMVSLFTTATTSTATPNCARRCLYMLESGVRYAFSELRHNEFDEDTINDLNNSTTTKYNVTDAGSFSVNVFSPWFVSQSPSEQKSNPYRLNIPRGRLPLDFIVPANSNVWVVNFEYLEDTDYTGSRSPVTAYTRDNDKRAIFNLSGDFNVLPYDRVCLGVQPDNTQGPLAAGADLYVERIAKDFFPRFNGAININRFDYSYERLVDEPGNNRVKLENLTAFRFTNLPGTFPLTVTKTTSGSYSGDFIVLSPRNHMVIPTGTSSLCSPPVSCGDDYDDGMNIFIHKFDPIPPRPDIDADEFTSNLRENETSSSFISVDTDADTLNIGGGVTPSGGVNPGVDAEFGAGWYEGSKTIGGNNTICQSGKCLFGRGVRVFFVLKFIERTGGQQGDGFTFTLMNAEGREYPNIFKRC